MVVYEIVLVRQPELVSETRTVNVIQAMHKTATIICVKKTL